MLHEAADWRGNSELDGSNCQNLLYFRHLPSPPQTANGSGSFGAGGAKALTHHRRGLDTTDQEAASHTNEREQSLCRTGSGCQATSTRSRQRE